MSKLTCELGETPPPRSEYTKLTNSGRLMNIGVRFADRQAERSTLGALRPADPYRE